MPPRNKDQDAMMAKNGWIPIATGADILCVSIPHFRSVMESGSIRHTRLLGRVYVARSDCEALIPDPA